MLSNIFVNELALDPTLGLTKGSNLFAENGQGDKFAVVRTFSPKPWAPELEDHREASIQVLVKGWTYEEGNLLAERIVKKIMPMAGDYVYKTETYNVREIALKQAPFGFRDSNDVLNFSVNLRVFYHLTIA